MSQKSVKKICIVVECLSNGGAEKIAAVLSGILHSKGYIVTIVSFTNDVSYQYSGQLITLDSDISKIKILKQVQKFFKLKNTINTIDADYVIDFRFRTRVIMEALLHLLVWPSRKMIFTIHSYNVHWHIPKGRLFVNWYKKGEITAVSQGIKMVLERDYKFKNVSYIPNVVDKLEIEKYAEEQFIQDDYIIAVGRLNNEIKQFDKLITCYKNSDLIKKGIKLYILGSGSDKKILEAQISSLNLESEVKLLGFKNNPFPYIKHAKFQVLCSKVEGFPMVILEALCLNTPVIAFNCNSGPSEMIIDNENGILVENQNFVKLKEAINNLANNKKALDALKNNTNQYIESYSLDNHYELWRTLLK